MATESSGAASVVNITAENFETEVVERSRQVPVLIDFWAPWCQPCQMLTPVLEKLAAEKPGAFVLAKANVDEQQELAGQFGVQSIPAVYAVRDGRIVDQFVGILPEEQLRAFIAGLAPTPAEQLAHDAAQLTREAPAVAEAKLREALALSPQDAAVQTALAQLLAGQDRLDESEQLLKTLTDRGFLEPEAERLQAELFLRRKAAEAGPVAERRAALETAPKDPEQQLRLAYALLGERQYAAAFDILLNLIRTDRGPWREAARQAMVHAMHFLGSDDPIATEYRRKLSAALY